MTETTPAPQGQLMHIGQVASLNIARALSLGEDKAKVIEQAIKDEINAMSSHFTLAVADVQTQYEVELTKIRSTFSFIRERPAVVGGIMALAFAAGFALRCAL
jgi:alpha-D-ribose 1-methylphosphonate 5-phosphate C-P lyase